MLSFRARGILAYLQENPGCPTNCTWLAGRAREGKVAVRTAIVELIEHGFLTEERLRDPESGKWRVRHVLTGQTPRDSP